jgi:hypothetical protein
VIGKKATGATLTDTSGAFTVYAVRIISPASGQIFCPNNDNLITWDTAPGVRATSVSLYWLDPRTNYWIWIKTLPGNPGSYLWYPGKLRGLPINNVRIKIYLRYTPFSTTGTALSEPFTLGCYPE